MAAVLPSPSTWNCIPPTTDVWGRGDGLVEIHFRPNDPSSDSLFGDLDDWTIRLPLLVARSHEGVFQAVEDTPTERRALLLDGLRSIQSECSSDNWDGYGAEAVSKKSLARAELLLASLPLSTPAPDPGAEPDGGLSLEWYARPGRYISLSIGPSSQVVGVEVDGDRIESWAGGIDKSFALDLVRRIRHLDLGHA